MKPRNIEATYEPDEFVLIKSLDSLKKKLDTIKADGPSKLSIVSDYDDTLVKSTYQKQQASNSFQVLENAEVIGPDLFDRLKKARSFYRPLEDDPSLSPEEKLKYMIEWRKLGLSCFIEKKLTKERIQRATLEGKLYFRFGTADFFKAIAGAGLKVHIVSGGVKAVVTESLKLLEAQHDLKLQDSVECIMTTDIYDENNALVRFGDQMLLTGNKEQFVTHKLCPNIHPGDNMIVMGDLVEDSWVVRNLDLKTTLAIGFIKEKSYYSEEQLKRLADAYDIVIGNDGSMVHVNELIRYVLAMETSIEYTKYANADILKLFT